MSTFAASMAVAEAYTSGAGPDEEQLAMWAAQGMKGTAAERLEECKDRLAGEYADICDAYHSAWLELDVPVDLKLDALGPPPEAE